MPKNVETTPIHYFINERGDLIGTSFKPKATLSQIKFGLHQRYNKLHKPWTRQ